MILRRTWHCPVGPFTKGFCMFTNREMLRSQKPFHSVVKEKGPYYTILHKHLQFDTILADPSNMAGLVTVLSGSQFFIYGHFSITPCQAFLYTLKLCLVMCTVASSPQITLNLLANLLLSVQVCAFLPTHFSRVSLLTWEWKKETHVWLTNMRLVTANQKGHLMPWWYHPGFHDKKHRIQFLTRTKKGKVKITFKHDQNDFFSPMLIDLNSINHLV